MCVNNLPKVATQWNSGATRDSNRGRRVLIPSALTTRPPSHATTDHYAEVCRPALRTLARQIGDEGLAVPDNRGSERWRPTCVHWILARRRQSDARRTERHGGDSWAVATSTSTSCWMMITIYENQGCRGYGDSHGDSHGYGYGMGMGTVMNPHGFGG